MQLVFLWAISPLFFFASLCRFLNEKIVFKDAIYQFFFGDLVWAYRFGGGLPLGFVQQCFINLNREIRQYNDRYEAEQTEKEFAKIAREEEASMDEETDGAWRDI